MSYAALKFGEAGVDVLKYVRHLHAFPTSDSLSIRSLRPLIVSMIPGQQRSLDNLKAMRVRLSNEVADLINDFGPKLHKEFNEVCLGRVQELVYVLTRRTVAHSRPFC